ncbi:carbohydrate ABC transporter permease [Bacillus sp. SA1-12]|uniref:carbohydrate ABC transporter permease n=1 Tax=Bacillus sp. SA1-12 TaxID=1455638 RepID=UPI000A07D029|nr:sugar ABC transporter permease [Bacillus sp. SA1-12]
MEADTRIETNKRVGTEWQFGPFIKKTLPKYLFIIPAFLFVVIFMLYPIFYNLFISFQDFTIYNLKGEKPFIGLENYRQIFQDERFFPGLKNTVIYTVSCIVFQLSIGFLLALFFNQRFPLRNFFRSILLLAWMTPLVITGTLFKWLYDVDYGVFNYFLVQMGLINEPINWLGQQSTALLAIIITNIWIGIPFNMILLLSALQALPNDVYEAAKIDGASRLQSFFKITIPLLKPAILVILVLGIIYTFKVFDIILIMTGGGPVNATQVLPFLGYELAFVNFKFGLSGAVATVILLILTCISLVYLYLIRKEESL